MKEPKCEGVSGICLEEKIDDIPLYKCSKINCPFNNKKFCVLCMMVHHSKNNKLHNINGNINKSNDIIKIKKNNNEMNALKILHKYEIDGKITLKNMKKISPDCDINTTETLFRLLGQMVVWGIEHPIQRFWISSVAASNGAAWLFSAAPAVVFV